MRFGISKRHGPHQLAQKATTSFFCPRKSASDTVRPSSVDAEKSGAGLYTSAGCVSSRSRVVSRTLARQVIRIVKAASSTTPSMAVGESRGLPDPWASLRAKVSIAVSPGPGSLDEGIPTALKMEVYTKSREERCVSLPHERHDPKSRAFAVFRIAGQFPAQNSLFICQTERQHRYHQREYRQGHVRPQRQRRGQHHD